MRMNESFTLHQVWRYGLLLSKTGEPYKTKTGIRKLLKRNEMIPEKRRYHDNFAYVIKREFIQKHNRQVKRAIKKYENSIIR